MWPTDTRCEAAYRQALLELEADNKIEVLSKDGKNLLRVDADCTPKVRPQVKPGLCLCRRRLMQ